MKKTLSFKVHTANLLNEIADNCNAAVLKIPLNVFRTLLCKVSERASQLNDPILNDLMCSLTLYEISDLLSPDYDKKKVEEIKKKAKKAVSCA